MTKPLDPYSRVYWRIAEDPRFAAIYPDERHLGTWLRLLVLADAMYPTAAPVPATARKASVKALVDCGLIELIPGGLYRVHGLASERERRSRAGAEPDPDRNPQGTAKEPHRTAAEPARTLARAGVAETRQDEQRQDEHEQAAARDGLPNLDKDAIRGLEDRTGRPWSLAGDKQLGEYDRLIADHGLVTVLGAFDAISDGKTLTARQLVWPAMKLLEPMPTPARVAPQEAAANGKSERIYARMVERRLEYFRASGKWDEAWGPQPEQVAS